MADHPLAPHCLPAALKPSLPAQGDITGTDMNPSLFYWGLSTVMGAATSAGLQGGRERSRNAKWALDGDSRVKDREAAPLLQQAGPVPCSPAAAGERPQTQAAPPHTVPGWAAALWGWGRQQDGICHGWQGFICFLGV